MLSQIIRIAGEFRSEYGENPDLLFLNYRHLEKLRKALEGLENLESMLELLGMRIVLSRQTRQPRVARHRAMQELARRRPSPAA